MATPDDIRKLVGTNTQQDRALVANPPSEFKQSVANAPQVGSDTQSLLSRINEGLKNNQGDFSDIFADLALAFTSSNPQSGFGKLAQQAKTGSQALLFNEFIKSGEASDRLSPELRTEGTRLRQNQQQITSQADLTKARVASLRHAIDQGDLSDSEKFSNQLELLQLNNDFSLDQKFQTSELQFKNQLALIDAEFKNNASGRELARQRLGIDGLRFVIQSTASAFQDGFPVEGFAEKFQQGIDTLVRAGVFTEAESKVLRPQGALTEDTGGASTDDQVMSLIQAAGGDVDTDSSRPSGKSLPLTQPTPQIKSLDTLAKARGEELPTEKESKEQEEARKSFNVQQLSVVKTFVESLSQFDRLTREEQLLLLTNPPSGAEVTKGISFLKTSKAFTGVSQEIAEEFLDQQSKLKVSLEGIK